MSDTFRLSAAIICIDYAAIERNMGALSIKSTILHHLIDEIL
jgi:hypothetical protein